MRLLEQNPRVGLSQWWWCSTTLVLRRGAWACESMVVQVRRSGNSGASSWLTACILDVQWWQWVCIDDGLCVPGDWWFGYSRLRLVLVQSGARWWRFGMAGVGRSFGEWWCCPVENDGGRRRSSKGLVWRWRDMTVAQGRSGKAEILEWWLFWADVACQATGVSSGW